jgi:hypothetical protein
VTLSAPGPGPGLSVTGFRLAKSDHFRPTSSRENWRELVGRSPTAVLALTTSGRLALARSTVLHSVEAPSVRESLFLFPVVRISRSTVVIMSAIIVCSFGGIASLVSLELFDMLVSNLVPES